jgi:hypothetical protein
MVWRMVMMLGLTTLGGCASVNARYDEAQRALSTGAWQQALDELTRFQEAANCPNDPRCESVGIDIAECRLRLGEPTTAFFALESARQSSPPADPIHARIELLEKEAQADLSASLTKTAGVGTLTVRFAVSVHERLRFNEARFFLDLHSLPTGDQPYVAGTTMLPVSATPVAAGTHELAVTTVLNGYGTGSYSYLTGYKFMARSHQKFEVKAGKPIEVDVRLYDTVEPGAPISDSLHIAFDVREPDATASSAKPAP